MTNKSKIIIFILIICVGFVFASFYSLFFTNLSTFNLTDEPFEVKKGESTKEIILHLNDKGFLTPNLFFVTYFKVYCFITRNRVYAGYYKLDDKTNNWQIFKMLTNKGFIEPIRITIPPSFEIRRIASILKNKLNIDSAEFVRRTKDKAILSKYSINAKSLEGYLYPDTYDFFWKSPIDLILRNLINRHKEIWDEEVEAKLLSQKLDKNEILTLASIVQGETSNLEEGKLVAGLYLNRMRIGMPLQADPTIQYVLPQRRRLNNNDYLIESPYNTYKIKGLPPTPIGNPNLNAILAVISPAKHDYIYMVAKGDGSGLHNFSKNYDQHLAFVETYRKNLTSNRNH